VGGTGGGGGGGLPYRKNSTRANSDYGGELGEYTAVYYF